MKGKSTKKSATATVKKTTNFADIGGGANPDIKKQI